jgi:hypothetical protein
MTDEEIEVVVEELAKSGGLSRYLGRVQGPHMGLVPASQNGGSPDAA